MLSVKQSDDGSCDGRVGSVVEEGIRTSLIYMLRQSLNLSSLSAPSTQGKAKLFAAEKNLVTFGPNQPLGNDFDQRFFFYKNNEVVTIATSKIFYLSDYTVSQIIHTIHHIITFKQLRPFIHALGHFVRVLSIFLQRSIPPLHQHRIINTHF